MWKNHVIITLLHGDKYMTTFEFYYNDVWNKTLEKIKESGKSQEEMPYFNSKLIELTDDEAKVVVTEFANFSIINENLALVELCLEEVINKKVKVRVLNQDDIVSPQVGGGTFNNGFISREIDPNQTFANFVVGRSNSQAHVAALTCAGNLGLAYNPLFIYGNSGLGKTHLLNAIGNQLLSIHPEKKIGFVNGLEFVEGVAKASKEGRLDKFKESFYDLDLLLVDDIQFIAGKDKTHEIFFTVFNNLINNKKQICITSDRLPSDIRGLEERIISRFNQGLTIGIDTPEYETSVNILKMEIQNSSPGVKYDVDEEVYNFLATNFSHDVRSLKGSVARLLFYSINFPIDDELDHITLKLATMAFKDQILENKNELSIPAIRKVVCDYYNLTKQQIISSTRTKNIANARHIAIYLCRKLLDAPYKEIGDEFGKRDHTTVMASYEKVEKLIKSDQLYMKAVNEIEQRLIK